MQRRDFVKGIGGSLAAWPLPVHAQQPTIPVVGLLNTSTADSFVTELAGLRRGLAEAGYVEGRNVTFEFSWAENELSRLPALAAELVNHQVAVLITTGGVAALRAAKMATTTIPVVFVFGGDPIKSGVVASLNRPGGNLTGVTFLTVTLSTKRLEILHQLLPRAKVITVLVNPDNQSAEDQSRELQDAAHALGLQIQILTARSDHDIETVSSRLLQARAEALLVSADITFTSRRNQIVASVARAGIPTIYPRQEYVAVGGLISYGPSVIESYRLAGAYSGRILRGEKPADLPVVQPTKFDLFINLKTANALGLEIPPNVLALADEVIE